MHVQFSGGDFSIPWILITDGVSTCHSKHGDQNATYTMQCNGNRMKRKLWLGWRLAFGAKQGATRLDILHVLDHNADKTSCQQSKCTSRLAR